MKSVLLILVSSILYLASLSAAQPNVIVFFIDDLGWADLGCYGSKFHETPNLDRLANNGVRFTQSYSANPVCSPTRAAVQTGKAPQRVGITQWIPQPSDIALPKKDTTLAETFKAAGYQTGYTGKWHLGEKENDLPASHGYTWMRATNRAGQPASYFFPYARKSNRGDYWNVPDLEKGKQGDYLTDALTSQAMGFIESNKNKPFFLYLPMPAPHTPWMPTPEFQGDTEVGWYGDFVAQTDWSVGRILAALDRNGLSENTIVIFTSDNGSHWPERMIEEFGHDANNGWRGQKADIYEAGHRVPFIVRWPAAVEAGTVSEQLVCTTDILATLAQVVRHDLADDEGEDSVSFLPVLVGLDNVGPLRQSVVHHSLNGTFAIRRGDWKLIHNQLGSGGFTGPSNRVPGRGDVPADIGGQLYNLSNDPAEQHNVWADHPDVVAELTELLDTIRE